jgi:hypothetical protein
MASNSPPPSESPPPSLPRRTTNGFPMPDPPRNPLETVPTQAHELPRNNIPNTPLSVATVSAVLAIVFTLGAGLFISGGVTGSWWATYQLGFFTAAWSFFHWAEFAVTAGWNRDKLSVDCKHLMRTARLSLKPANAFSFQPSCSITESPITSPMPSPSQSSSSPDSSGPTPNLAYSSLLLVCYF